MNFKRRERVYSLLEFAIVISLISVLITFAIDRLLPLTIAAERVAMQQTVGAIKSALSIELAGRAVTGGLADIAKLEYSNPMAYLAEIPTNYLGERAALEFSRIEPGNWYFDRQQRALVYRVRNQRFFASSRTGSGEARFQVRLLYDDVNGNGRWDAASDRIRGLRLVAMESFRWLQEPR